MFIEDFDFRYMMHFLKIVKKRIINKKVATNPCVFFIYIIFRYQLVYQI